MVLFPDNSGPYVAAFVLGVVIAFGAAAWRSWRARPSVPAGAGHPAVAVGAVVVAALAVVVAGTQHNGALRDVPYLSIICSVIVALALTVVAVLARPARTADGRRYVFYRTLFAGLSLACAWVIVALTLSAQVTDPEKYPAVIIPFKDLIDRFSTFSWNAVLLTVVQLVMYSWIGFFLPSLFKMVRTLPRIAGIALVFSEFMQLLQMSYHRGVATFDAMMLATIGATLAGIVGKRLVVWLRAQRGVVAAPSSPQPDAAPAVL